MNNLLGETIKILEKYSKTLDDIIAITDGTYEISKEDFIKLADTYYDDGYGDVEVAPDIKLVGSNFWLERGHYDGSEWWEYKQIPNTSNLILIQNPKSFIKPYVGYFYEAITGKDEKYE